MYDGRHKKELYICRETNERCTKESEYYSGMYEHEAA
jgi:hypothetical protein